MKKIISILLATMLICTFCSCAKTETTTEETTEGESVVQSEEVSKITGMIYGVFNADPSSILSTEFSCNGGVITPARIAAGLSGWTGLKFRVSVETDEANKRINVDWLPESTLSETQVPESQRPDFTFENVDEMRIFMLNSFCYSITENLGDYDVFYTINGEDISSLGIDGLSSETAFNKTTSESVFVK